MTKKEDEAAAEVAAIEDQLEQQPPQAPPPPAEEPPQQQPQAPKPGSGQRPNVEVQAGGVMLKNLDDLGRFAGMIVTAGMAPKWAYARVGTKEQGWTPEAVHRAASAAVGIAIQAGLEHGMTLLGGLQAFIVIDAKLTWRAEFAAAKIRNSEVCKKGTLRFWTEVDKNAPGDVTKMVGYAVGHRVSYKEEDVREFSWADAVTAGLTGKKGDMYKKYPKRMLMWRALGLLGKDVFSDVLGGIPLAEEVALYTEDEPHPMAMARSRQAPSLHAALPAASGASSLFEELKLKKPEAEIVGVSARGADPHFEGEASTAAPPFMSHAEADAALAAEEDGQ